MELPIADTARAMIDDVEAPAARRKRVRKLSDGALEFTIAGALPKLLFGLAHHRLPNREN